MSLTEGKLKKNSGLIGAKIPKKLARPLKPPRKITANKK
jgi:hypothetical protein